MAGAARQRVKWGAHDCERTLHMMEGLLSDLRGRKPQNRPAQVTHVYLAAQFGVSAPTMRSRLQDAMSKRARSDKADHFCELWAQIANVLGERISGTIYQIAVDPTNRNCLNAAKWMIERTDKETYSMDEAKQARDAGSAVADVPQEVWDELTDEEEAQLAEIEMAIDSEMHKLTRLVRRVQRRVADKRASDVEID